MRKANAVKRLFIHGAYGCESRGDKAVPETVVRYLQDTAPNHAHVP